MGVNAYVPGLEEYKIDLDRRGHVRGRFLMKREQGPFEKLFALDKKVKEKFPDAELLMLKRCKCDLKGDLNWWICKWAQYKYVVKIERVVTDGARKR